MVDSIGGAGAPQNILQLKGGQAQKAGDSRKDSLSVAEASDEVRLSPEALSLSEAEGAIARIRAFLEEHQARSLSSGERIGQFL